MREQSVRAMVHISDETTGEWRILHFQLFFLITFLRIVFILNDSDGYNKKAFGLLMGWFHRDSSCIHMECINTSHEYWRIPDDISFLRLNIGVDCWVKFSHISKPKISLAGFNSNESNYSCIQASIKSKIRLNSSNLIITLAFAKLVYKWGIIISNYRIIIISIYSGRKQQWNCRF